MADQYLDVACIEERHGKRHFSSGAKASKKLKPRDTKYPKLGVVWEGVVKERPKSGLWHFEIVALDTI